MKLEVGMYVRFKDKRGNTYIRRIVEIPKDNRYGSIYIDKESNYSTYLSLKNIIKASHTLLGNDEEHCLIEVGDYVNGYKVLNVTESFVDIDCEKPSNESYIFDDDIKSIITKEQFESMSYKVGD